MSEADGEVRACPECDKAGITPRQGWSRLQVGEEKYRCRKCGHRFDEPKVREPKDSSHPGGLQKKLLEMDPDDLAGGTA